MASLLSGAPHPSPAGLIDVGRLSDWGAGVTPAGDTPDPGAQGSKGSVRSGSRTEPLCDLGQGTTSLCLPLVL